MSCPHSDETGCLQAVEPFVEAVRARLPHQNEVEGLPADLFARLGATGFLSCRWSGGRQEGLRRALAVVADLAPLDGGAALAFSLHSEVFLGVLHRFRSNPLVAELFAGGLTGAVVGSLALTEDGGGSNPAAITTTATAGPDNTWLLQGHKRYISNLDFATHSLVLAHATSGDRQGPTLFLIALDAAGVDRVGTYPKLGTRSVDAWRIELSTRLAPEARLGPIGGGLPSVLRALRHERLAVAVAVTAGARHSLGIAAAYLRRRKGPDGRLYDRSALAHLVAQSWTRLEAASASIDRLVARDIDGTATDADYAATKLFCATTATDVADVALQLMGGRGYTQAFPQERIWRDARLGRIGAGTDQMMLEIVADHLDRPSRFDLDLEVLMAADEPVPGRDRGR